MILQKRLPTYLHLVNSNENKHGNILINLSSKKILKNDQHSKTIAGSYNVLSNYKTFREFKKNNKNNL